MAKIKNFDEYGDANEKRYNDKVAAGHSALAGKAFSDFMKTAEGAAIWTDIVSEWDADSTHFKGRAVSRFMQTLKSKLGLPFTEWGALRDQLEGFIDAHLRSKPDAARAIVLAKEYFNK